MKYTDKDNEIVHCLFALARLYALLPAALLLDGFVIVKFWGWFVLPTFAGAPQLPIAAAVGISSMVALIAHQQYSGPESDRDLTEILVWQLVYMFVRPLIFLFMGWLISMFMGGS